jgi:hypothetical protein
MTMDRFIVSQIIYDGSVIARVLFPKQSPVITGFIHYEEIASPSEERWQLAMTESN